MSALSASVAADMLIWVNGYYFGLRDAHFQPCIVINGHFQYGQSINLDLYCDLLDGP